MIKTMLTKICNHDQKDAPSEGDQTKLDFNKKTMIIKNEEDVREVYKISKKELGRGAFGAVYKCTHRALSFVRAVKIISKSKIQNVDKFWLEINILIELDHPNVLKLYEYFESDNNIYLITELCQGGELFDKIVAEGCFSEKYAAELFR